MIEAWKKQFSLKQLSLVHDNPITFVISQWQREPRPNVAYLIYRWLMAIAFFTILVIGVVDLKHPEAPSSFRAKWLIYLTNWGFTICTLQSLLGAVMSSGFVLGPRLQNTPKLGENSLKLYKIYWATHIIATDMAFGITTLYWSLIYDEKTMELDAMNFLVHANNSVLMMIDLFVVAHPVRLLHCCYPVVFGLCYALFSVIFYAAGGISREGHTYIYTILNWDKPLITTAICVAVTGFIIFVHAVVWGLHKLRLLLHSAIIPPNSDVDLVVAADADAKNKRFYVNEGLANDVV